MDSFPCVFVLSFVSLLVLLKKKKKKTVIIVRSKPHELSKMFRHVREYLNLRCKMFSLETPKFQLSYGSWQAGML